MFLNLQYNAKNKPTIDHTSGWATRIPHTFVNVLCRIGLFLFIDACLNNTHLPFLNFNKHFMNRELGDQLERAMKIKTLNGVAYSFNRKHTPFTFRLNYQFNYLFRCIREVSREQLFNCRLKRLFAQMTIQCYNKFVAF